MCVHGCVVLTYRVFVGEQNETEHPDRVPDLHQEAVRETAPQLRVPHQGELVVR